MTTKLFIHDNVPDHDLFLNGLRSDISVLEFDPIPMDALRIGFVWENSKIMQSIPFGSTIHPDFIWFSQELVDFFSLNSTLAIDFITCNLGKNIEFLEELNRIKILFPFIKFEYSLDETGNREGNWILESSGVDIKPIYFTEEINQWNHTLMISFASVLHNKKPITFYTPCTIKGTTNSGYIGADISNVITICSNNNSAYAALLSNGSVVAWGNAAYGGDISGVALQLASGVVKLFYTQGAFAALKSDGSVVTWGLANQGGNSLSVSAKLASGVVNVFSNTVAFAALKSNGSVITWGVSAGGGNSLTVSGNLLSGVINIISTYTAFAALKSDGSVVTWGLSTQGGDSTSVSANLTSDVVNICSTTKSFAALKSNGSVITWGDQNSGGNSSLVASDLSSNIIIDIVGSYEGFTAFTSNGGVISWGANINTGSNIVTFLSIKNNVSSDVLNAIGNAGSFAAVKSNGTVVTWGVTGFGGNSSDVSSNLTNVIQIFGTGEAFAALKSDGSVITWRPTNNNGGNSTLVASSISSDVINIFTTVYAMAALKSDGSVITWGNTSYGGNTPSTGKNITYIFEGNNNFVSVSTSSKIPITTCFMSNTDGSINILQTDYNSSNIVSHQYKFTHNSDNWINLDPYTRNITGLSASTTYNLYLRATNSIAPGDNKSFLVKTDSSGQLKVNVYVTNTILVPMIPTIIKQSFVSINKTIGYSSVTLTNPTTNSTGVWSYASSNPSVVTIYGNIVTIVSIGVSTITATLASTTDYEGYSATDITMQFTIQDRDTASVGLLEIPSQLLSSQTYSIQNPSKPLDHSGSWVYSSANESIATVSGNIIFLNRKGIVKITASLSQNADYKSVSLNTQLFVTSIAADPSSNFTFINTDSITNAFTPSVLNTIPVSSGTATISSSILTSINVQPTLVLGGNSEQKQANRDLLLDTLFTVLDSSVKSVEIPKEYIYIPPQIPASVSSVKVFTSEGSTVSQPLTIDSSNIPQNQALFCPLKTDTEVMKLNGSGVFQNDSITIRRSIGDTYSVTTYDSVLHITTTKVYNKGDFIIFAGLVIVLGSITVSNFPYPLSNICFPAGEMVLTDSGYKPIERVKKGVDTIRGETIVEVTATRTHDKTLVQIEKNAIIAGVPNKRTLVSNHHKLLFKGKMVIASQLVGRRGVTSVLYSGQPLYNILLKTDSKMIVNGLIAETLHPENNIAMLYEYLNESKNIALIESYNQTYKRSK